MLKLKYYKPKLRKIERRLPKNSGKRYLLYMRKGKTTKILNEHSVVWKLYGGTIPDGYVLHHIDCNPLNNSIENLSCIEEKTHVKLHGDINRAKQH